VAAKVACEFMARSEFPIDGIVTFHYEIGTRQTAAAAARLKAG
jgi:hypothetical protein